MPTSHRWAEYPPGQEAFVDDPELDLHDMVMPAGSVAIWAGGVWHGSGANSSESWRDAVNMNYCRGVVRQQENAMLTTPRELVLEMPPRLQALVGYTPAAGQAAREGKRGRAAKVLARAREAARGSRARERNRGVPGAQGAWSALNESKLRK